MSDPAVKKIADKHGKHTAPVRLQHLLISDFSPAPMLLVLAPFTWHLSSAVSVSLLIWVWELWVGEVKQNKSCCQVDLHLVHALQVCLPLGSGWFTLLLYMIFCAKGI